MTTKKRLESIEDHNLTPRESMILWMTETHSFRSLKQWAQWLMTQPDDVYPLIRLPRQVVEAVRAQNKGVKDEDLRDEFLRVQKDVLFLYFLHEELAMRFESMREAVHLRVVGLLRGSRELILTWAALRALRLERFDPIAESPSEPGEEESSLVKRYEARAESWENEADELEIRVRVFLGAAGLIAHRYLGGAEMLFPEVRESTGWILDVIALLREQREELREMPDLKEEFRSYLSSIISESIETPDVDEDESAREDLDVTGASRELARRIILAAKAQTLEKLGEEREAEALADQLLREVL